MFFRLLPVSFFAILFLVGCSVRVPTETKAMGEWRETQLNGKKLTLEVVTSSRDIKQGLSDRTDMAEDHGMLFKFEQKAKHSFWMRNMWFSLDMIFLDDGKVVDIAKDMPSPNKTFGIPKTHTSKAEADAVLELKSGGADRYGIKEGDVLNLP